MDTAWIDPDFFPFPTRTMRCDAGDLAYTDVGSGPAVLMLHGNPTWAALYRHLIRALAPNYRCIAPDYIGFGRSSKPAGWSYRPEDHASHIEAFVRHLGLDDITLMLHDWGGPIGLSYALRHPHRVKRFAIFNTWGWPLTHDPKVRAFSLLLGSPVGRFLIERYNLFGRAILPSAFGDPGRLSGEAWQHYLTPLRAGPARTASWVFPRALLGSTHWLRALWADRHRIANHPALLCWGMQDAAFGSPRYLQRWMGLFTRPTVHRFPSVGHYVPEEAGTRLNGIVSAFLQTTS